MNELELIQAEGVASIKDLLKESENTVIQITDTEEAKKRVTDIALKHTGMIVTKENFDEAKKARRELLTTRTSLEKISAHNTKVYNTAKDASKLMINELIAITTPVEDELDKQIKVIEQEKALKKAEEERVEKERIEKIETSLRGYSKDLNELFVKVKLGEAELPVYIAKLEALKVENFEEFQFNGEALYHEFEAKTAELRDYLKKKADEAKELADLKKKQADEAEAKRVEKEVKDKRFAIRLGILEKLELVYDKQAGTFRGEGISFYHEQVYNPDDKQWDEFLKWVKDTVKKAAKDKADREKLAKEKAEFKKQQKEADAKAAKVEFDSRRNQLIALGFIDDQAQKFLDAPYLRVHYSRLMDCTPDQFTELITGVADLEKRYKDSQQQEQEKIQRFEKRAAELKEMGFELRDNDFIHETAVTISKTEIMKADDKGWQKVTVKHLRNEIKKAGEAKKQAELANKEKQAELKEMRREGKDFLYFLDVCLSKMVEQTPKFKSKIVNEKAEVFHREVRVKYEQLAEELK